MITETLNPIEVAAMQAQRIQTLEQQRDKAVDRALAAELALAHLQLHFLPVKRGSIGPKGWCKPEDANKEALALRIDERQVLVFPDIDLTAAREMREKAEKWDNLQPHYLELEGISHTGELVPTLAKAVEVCNERDTLRRQLQESEALVERLRANADRLEWLDTLRPSLAFGAEEKGQPESWGIFWTNKEKKVECAEATHLSDAIDQARAMIGVPTADLLSGPLPTIREQQSANLITLTPADALSDYRDEVYAASKYQLIYFEDQDKRTEIYNDFRAAVERWQLAVQSWTCHLFVQVDAAEIRAQKGDKG